MSAAGVFGQSVEIAKSLTDPFRDGKPTPRKAFALACRFGPNRRQATSSEDAHGAALRLPDL
jgi:hypothetical protein